MATTYAFVIILPNARRTSVKANTNTTILEVLENVCKKHELNPTEFDFTHHNKVVDLGNTIRFSGLPNNATLELVTATKARTESPVNLGLQLESGKRLTAPFFPYQTLWDVLEYWSQKGEAIHHPSPPVIHQHQGDNEGQHLSSEVKPVCIYMRQEIAGQDQLEIKTLRSLGLTKGSAIIRLVYRSESQLRTQANVSAPLSRPNTSAQVPERREVNTSIEKENSSSRPRHSQLSPSTIKSEDSPRSKPAEYFGDGSKSGDSHLPPEEPMDLSPDSPRKGDEQKQRSHLQQDSKPEPHHVPQFSPPIINNAARFSKRGELHVIGPHDAILYHGDDVLIDAKDDSVDDSFFELSVNEVKQMYMDLQKKREEMENSPLTSQSTKELEKDTNTLRMLHDYPTTIVRIRFANRYILQGRFRTCDKLEIIHSWLSSLMSNPQLNFYLFTAPPKKVLDRNCTLVEQEVVGMAVLYFGSGQETQTQSDQKELRADLYSKVSAPDAVNQFVHKKLGKSETVPLQAITTASSSKSTTSEHPTPEPERSRTPPPPLQRKPPPPKHDSGSVPKWFKK